MKLIFGKLNSLKKMAVVATILFGTATVSAESSLDNYFRFLSEGNELQAAAELKTWKPKGFIESSYKKYFLSLSSKKAVDFWRLYQDIAKNKKLFKLQHESIKKILEMDIESKKSIVGKFNRFGSAAKQMLKKLRAQPEGVEFEARYLQWIVKNKNKRELCRTEKNRWLSQTTLSLPEIMGGMEYCPMKYDDFVFRTRMLIFSGEENKARTEIDEFSSLKKLSDWEKAYLEAIFYSNMGDPTAAYGAAIPFESEIKKKPDYYENLFYISQRAGELGKAEEIVNSIIENTKLKKKRKDLVFQKGFLFYQTKRYDEANTIFTELISSHPAHKKKNKTREYDELTWLSAWCSYLAKDYGTAHSAFTKNSKWTADKARNLYWLAQTEAALGNQMLALSYFRQLALPVLEGKAFSYYNYIAWLRFESNKAILASDYVKNQMSTIKNGRGQFDLPDFSVDPSDLLEEYESYFKEFGAANEGDVQLINQDEMNLVDSQEIRGISVNTPEELKNQITWAENLVKWGYGDLAKWHLLEVEKTLKSKSAVEPLIEYYTDKKYYNRALHLASNVLPTSGKLLNKKEDPLLWGSLFPKAYETSVDTEAKKRKIHPYLIWSIMKAETQYKSDAISPVGAVGLMQFMPYTSKKVAGLLNDNYKTDKLFEPDSAIKYGAMYLKKLSDELGGQIPLVAAAYNGGPHRVKLWLKNFREKDGTNVDYDVFIEHIPFAETRTYVKRVLNYYLTYQKLYEDKIDLKTSKWIVDKIPFKLKEPVLLKEEWPNG